MVKSNPFNQVLILLKNQ